MRTPKLLHFTGKFLFIASMLFSSCDDSDTPDEIISEPNVRALSSGETEVSLGAGNFAFDLMAEIEAGAPNENFFISSFSVSAALSMVTNGASEEAQVDFIHTLGLEGMSIEAINASYQTLTEYIYGLDPRVILNIANSNWYYNRYTINPDFENTLTAYYDAEIFAKDFQAASTLDEINGWVEEETNGKIKDILSEVKPEDVMFLINAIYFKAKWTNPFDEETTTDMPFTLSDGGVVEVPTMKGEIKHWMAYWNDINASVIEIPYGNENYGLTIVMPNDPNAIEGLIAQIKMEELNAVLADSVTQVRELYLPKISLDFKKDLKENLMNMGMPITSLDNLFEETLPLEIGKVIHQSFLEINEEGTEAAAATVIGIEVTSLPAATHVDRPFLFFIRERNSGTILFSGKLVDPS